MTPPIARLLDGIVGPSFWRRHPAGLILTRGPVTDRSRRNARCSGANDGTVRDGVHRFLIRTALRGLRVLLDERNNVTLAAIADVTQGPMDAHEIAERREQRD
jgi:hypothetical protein